MRLPYLRNPKVNLGNTCNMSCTRIQPKSPIINWRNIFKWDIKRKALLVFCLHHPHLKKSSLFRSMTHITSYLLLSLYVFLLLIPLNCKLQGQDVFLVCPKVLAYLAHREYQFVKFKHREGRDLIPFILHCILSSYNLAVHNCLAFRFRD